MQLSAYFPPPHDESPGECDDIFPPRHPLYAITIRSKTNFISHGSIPSFAVVYCLFVAVLCPLCYITRDRTRNHLYQQPTACRADGLSLPVDHNNTTRIYPAGEAGL